MALCSRKGAWRVKGFDERNSDSATRMRCGFPPGKDEPARQGSLSFVVSQGRGNQGKSSQDSGLLWTGLDGLGPELEVCQTTISHLVVDSASLCRMNRTLVGIRASNEWTMSSDQ